MNTVEDRLRDAYRAAAETVRPETVLAQGVRGLRDDDPPRARRPRRWPARGRLLIPLAAAAAVAAVAIGASVLLPRPAPARGGPPRPAAGRPRTSPAFFVALNWSLHPSMVVVNATTGTRGATIRLPFRATELTGVATGDGRTFVAAARTAACRTRCTGSA